MRKTGALASILIAAATMGGLGLSASAQETPPSPTATVAATDPLPGLRPKSRPAGVANEHSGVTMSTKNIGFRTWIKSFRGRALAQGIQQTTFDSAFGGVQYNTNVIQRDRNQSEFTRTIWEYLDSAVSDTRIENGRLVLRDHADTLDQIEKRYGVDKEVVAAVWGMESAYGNYRGETPIVEALATLAFDGRRGKFFEAQLVAALKIVQNGDVSASDMTGSWAGAMGHTQFIPTSYLAYAVDFGGDGKRDIWSNDPTDALASTAAYLARFGWVKGQPWGVEVTLPKGFDYSQANRKIRKTAKEWEAAGVASADGDPIGDHGQGSILLPAGAQGAAFLVFHNFGVIERYNTADAYVIGVGHLSDRLRGAGPIKTAWPRGDRALNFAERKEMQQRLTSKGFSTRGVDGKIGPRTVAAIRSYQRSAGLIPDGYPSLNLLENLR